MKIEEIQELARDREVRLIRLQFLDILGIAKNVAIPIGQLKKALEEGIAFDGSSIEGFTRIEESDMLLQPVLDSFAVFPWQNREHREARLICNVLTPDGRQFRGDPRYVLQRAVEEAAAMGYIVNTGPECEFFLFRQEADGQPSTQTQDQGGYFDLSPVDQGEDARRDIVLALEDMGFEIEAAHHETAPGQHEIDFRYADALTTADRVTTFRSVTRTIAARHGLQATFMPKPLVGFAGSGMHIHLSLFKNGKNIFFAPERPFQLSEVASHFIGGLLAHARELTALTNPLVNSYKRLVPGFEAPVYISWSAENRSALVRVPSGRGQSTRLEYRSPDPSCNPYLAFAAIIRAGLDGIQQRLAPPESASGNIYRKSEAERQAEGLGNLPESLWEALEVMSRSELIRETLGEHIFQHFLAAKTIEWDVYRTQVHRWEVEQYLKVF